MTDAEEILEAALAHVVFDGWSEATYQAALKDTDVDAATGKALFPRGALDLAIAFHKQGDAEMKDRLTRENLLSMRFRDRVAAGVRYRIEAADAHKEAVRRGTTLFSLPQYAPEGAKLVWGTADTIWDTLGDTSEDYNWYTKRATLSAVYSATVLYWLGDNSSDQSPTWEFLDRRIENVMQFEQFKSQVKGNPIASKFLAGPEWFLSRIRKPVKMPDPDLPGRWNPTPPNSDA